MNNNTSEKNNYEFDYLAFVSYSHTNNRDDDRKWASWLHGQLETYEIPAKLIATKNNDGEEIPESIYPIFRDEVSLPADASLEESISQALDRSRYLIVLCSPKAVESRYVNEEILHFKRSGGSDRIIPVIIDGEPEDYSNSAKKKSEKPECFPEALRYEVDENGQLDRSQPSEPIAADFRLPDGSQGFTNPNAFRRQLAQSGISLKESRIQTEAYEQRLNNARIKIISGIIGVSPEQLTERDKAYQLVKAKAAAKRFRRIASAMTALTVCAVAAGLYAFSQFKRAESTLTDLRSNLGFMNVDLRMLLTRYVPSEQRGPVIEQIDTVIESLQRNDRLNDADRHQFSAALKHKADELKSSDPDKAFDLYSQSIETHRKLLESKPEDPERKHNLSVTLIDIGDFHVDRSEFDLAMPKFQEATRLRQTLVSQDPNNRFWHRELSTSLNRESILLQKQGRFGAALKQLRISLEIAEENFDLKPNDSQTIRDLYISWNLIGNTLHLSKDLSGALQAFSNSLDINRQAYEGDPKNLNLKRDLSVGFTNLGDLLLDLNNPTQAIENYQKGFQHAQELLSFSPKHPTLIVDLVGNHIGLGRAHENSDPDIARSHFSQARDLLEPVITAEQIDDDRKHFPETIRKAITKLEDKM